MTLSQPFTVTVYDGKFRRRGWIGSPTTVNAVLRHNALSTAEVVIDADHPRVPDLIAPGARLVITYDGRHLISGPVTALTGTGPARQSTLAVTIEDDWRVLTTTLGWPNPTAPITVQSKAYDRRSAAAETVVKYFAAQNFPRIGQPVTVAPDQGRGDRVTIQVRMHPLADRLYPAIDQAGIGVTVRQEGAGLVLDCYVPQVRKRVMSEESGALVGWEWTRTAPGATRVVVGGQGAGTAREFVQVTDTARETEWVTVAEEFRDARDVGSSSEKTDASGNPVPLTPDEVVADLTARGQERLTEASPMSGLSLTLAESQGFRYGQHLRVGDTVTVRVGPTVTVTEQVREVQLAWAADTGVTVTPIVGQRQDDPDTILRRVVNDIARSVRALRAQ